MDVEPTSRKRGLDREDGHVRVSFCRRFLTDIIVQEGKRARR
jgi:hypothetical protein